MAHVLAQPVETIDDEEIFMVDDDSEDDIEILDYGELYDLDFLASPAIISTYSLLH